MTVVVEEKGENVLEGYSEERKEMSLADDARQTKTEDARQTKTEDGTPETN